MKRYVNVYEFRDIMMTQASFSYEGAEALFDYLEDLEHDIGEEIEFDPVAFRSEFSEYESVEEAKRDILVDPDEYDDDEFEDEFVVYIFDEGVIVHHH